MNEGTPSTRPPVPDRTRCQWQGCQAKATTVTRFKPSLKTYQHCSEHVAVLSQVHPLSFEVVQ